jgi:hypothetical protein
VCSLATNVAYGGFYDQEATALKAVGATWVRHFVLWHLTEPGQGRFHWTEVDNAVLAAQRSGLKVLLCVTGPAPVWAQGRGSDPLHNGSTAADPSNYGRFCAALAARHPGVQAYELWNEANLPFYWAPPNVEKYVALLKAGYTAIKTTAPNAIVLSTGLSSDRSGITDAVFVDELYARGGGAFLDGVCLHPYTAPYRVAADPHNRQTVVLHTRDVMTANGDAGKKIWLTEWGQCTGTSQIAVSETEQAASVLDYLTVCAGIDYLVPFVFTARDLGTDKKIPDANFGLHWLDWSPKLAARQLKTRYTPGQL